MLGIFGGFKKKIHGGGKRISHAVVWDGFVFMTRDVGFYVYGTNLHSSIANF
jgi:hypothetical protein